MAIREVRPDEEITAELYNQLVRASNRIVVGPNSLQTPDGVYLLDGGGGGARSEFRWCIVREIADDADLTVKVEYARKGRDYDSTSEEEDFGRWVGDHEFMRTGDSPPDPIPPFADSLIDANLFPHTVAHDWRYALYPDPADSGVPLYRATHVDDTDIILAMMVGGSPMLVPIWRDASGEVAETTRQYDCTVEAP